MRPPEEVKRELVRNWLAMAEEDFRVAEHLYSEKTPYLRAIGFHAQQAAEKFLKAYLVYHQIEFPKTHDLGELLDLLGSADAPLAKHLHDIIILNPYGVETRYPSDFPEMTPEETEAAVKLAGEVRDAINNALKNHK